MARVMLYETPAPGGSIGTSKLVSGGGCGQRGEVKGCLLRSNRGHIEGGDGSGSSDLHSGPIPGTLLWNTLALLRK